MMPVTIKAFYGTWLERVESESQERNAAATTKLNTSSVRLYQAAGADLGMLGHHRVIFFLFYVNEIQRSVPGAITVKAYVTLVAFHKTNKNNTFC